MKLFKETDVGIMPVLEKLLPDDFYNAYAGTLGDLVGRNGVRSVNHYNQWRTVLPYLVSLTIWLLTGKPYAPGNRHVHDTPHHEGNVHGEFTFDDTELQRIRTAIRELFAYGEVQDDGNGIYEHRLVIGKNEYSILIRLLWQHRRLVDNIIINVRVYEHEIQDLEINMHEVLEKFALLGM